MDIRVEKQGQWAVLALDARLDVNSASELEKKGLELVASGEKRFILDMSQLNYISSAGLRSILVIGKKAKANGGQLVLCGLEGIVKEVFEMSGFDSFFKAYETVQEVPSI